MGTEAYRAWLWTVVSGALCGLAFPPVGWWWTVLCAPALWLRVLKADAAKANAWLGLWWGLALGATMSWHAAPTFAQEAHAEWLGGVAWTLALLWFAGWSALFGWLIGWVRLSGWAWAAAAACAWTALAWLRSLGALGFPWAMLSLGLARQPLWLQAADVGGVWLTEWLILACNGALAQAMQGRMRLLGGLAALSIAWAGYGIAQLQRYRSPVQTPLAVAVVQPQADIPVRIYAPTLQDKQMEQRLQLAAQQGARWAVLPEVAEPYTLTAARGVAALRLQQWSARARQQQLVILLGAQRHEGNHYNSAVGVSPSGEVRCYDKAKLMAFTEWSPPPPLRLLLQPLGVGERSLSPGSAVHSLRLGQQPPVGALICVESLFGWIARAQVQDGAQWLAVMANDSWLVGRVVREQYADFCVLRAIETRRWIARASSVGLSGFYAPTGELTVALPVGAPNVLTRPIEPRVDYTPYVRWGDWWVYLCVFGSVAALAVRRCRGAWRTRPDGSLIHRNLHTLAQVRLRRR